MKHTFIFITTAILLYACATQQVNVDYDRKANFDQFKTYQFDNQPLGLSQLDSTRLYSAIQENLKAKGLTPQVNPDILIKIKPNEYVSQNAGQTVGVGLGGGRGGFGGGVNIGIPVGGGKRLNQDFKIGMYDLSNNQMVWEGVLNIQLKMNSSPKSREDAYVNGVKKLLENYPPKN